MLNVHRNHKAYYGRGDGDGRGYGGRGRGRLYTYRYTVTTRMTPALRWAAMRAIFNVSVGSDGQSHRAVSTNIPFWRERRAEAALNQGPSTYQPNALPLGQTGSLAIHVQTLDSEISVLMEIHKAVNKNLESIQIQFCAFLSLSFLSSQKWPVLPLSWWNSS